MKELELIWNVGVINGSDNGLKPYNVFNNVTMYETVEELYSKKNLRPSKEYISEILRKAAMYAFWSKCEYEFLVAPLFSPEKEIKVDVYTCLEINWDAFVSYVYNFIVNN